MRAGRRQLGVVVLGAVLLVAALSSCSSSAKSGASATSSSAPASTSSSLPALPTTAPVDPNQVANPTPFDVGEMAAIANDWTLGVTKVQRPFTAAGLAALPAGEQYVCVDVTMINNRTTPVTVKPRALFTLIDESGRSHAVVSGAAGEIGLAGTYAAGATRSGHLVFAVPEGKQLVMQFDGPLIDSQRAVFQVDPPTHPAQD